MAKLNTNSNAYTIVYSTVLVVIVAFLLAFVASSLKETQDKNEKRDTKSQILAALNIRDIQNEEVDAKYAEVIKEGVGVDDAAEPYFNAKNVGEDASPYLVAEIDGQKKTVIPVKGAGLWGGLWGYVAVNEDGKTIYGCFFNHESETAGLGARIKEQWFQDLFCGKTIYNENGEVNLGVYKKGKAPAGVESVDAVTGATLTCNGVHDMLKNGFEKYSQVLLSSAPAAADQIPAVEDYENINEENTVDQPIEEEN